MKKTIMEQLGLETVKKLNKTICMERVRFLRGKLRQDKVPARLERHAKYYASWYGWMAENGGTRGKKRAA
jgi:hypothetical protein